MINIIKKYIYPIVEDSNHRYKSWEHCYNTFDSSNDIDYLSLNLSFYLASWGMYRGSSGLLWKDYKIHKPAIKILLNNYDLRITDCQNTEKVLILKSNLFNYYSSIKFINGKNKSEFFVPSDTLLSKILLGSLGCIPALDRYFNLGFSNSLVLNITAKTLSEIFTFANENSMNIRECQDYIFSIVGTNYPTMKIIDMYFWQIGFEKSKLSESIDDFY